MPNCTRTHTIGMGNALQKTKGITQHGFALA